MNRATIILAIIERFLSLCNKHEKEDPWDLLLTIAIERKKD